MKISVGIVTRNGPVATTRAALSAAVGSDDILVVNNDCTAAHKAALHKTLDGIATFINFDVPTGLAKCWNTIVLAAKHDWVVISNDDVKFDADWVATLERCMAECPNALHVGIAYPTNNYSCFAIHKSLIEKIGWFDERFTDYYMEDDDWHLRLSEFAKEHVGRAWTAGRRDGVFASCDAANHDRRFQDTGSGGGLSKTANAEFFHKKWESCDDGWWMKGKIDGRYLKMRRKLPEIDWHGART